MALLKKPEYFWPVLWGGASLILVAVLVLENQFGRSAAGDGRRAPAKVAEAKLLPAFRLPPEPQAGAETLARPLFVPGRRPSPPAAAEGPVAIKRGQFILQGTVVVGPLSIAMLKEVSTGTIHRVEKGGEVMGMKLAEVSAEQVVLKVGGDSETLPLLVAKGAGTVVAPAASGNSASAGTGPLPVPAAARTPLPHAGAISGPVPTATAGSSAMTPEEILARRSGARRPQQQN